VLLSKEAAVVFGVGGKRRGVWKGVDREVTLARALAAAVTVVRRADTYVGGSPLEALCWAPSSTRCRQWCFAGWCRSQLKQTHSSAEL
jgi:hypothetical protein